MSEAIDGRASVYFSLGSLVEITDGKVSLSQKLGLITEHWRPKVVGELNGQDVKLAKFQGTVVWHHHEHEGARALCTVGKPSLSRPALEVYSVAQTDDNSDP